MLDQFKLNAGSEYFRFLWQNDIDNRDILIALSLPSLLLWAAMLYWLQRLFKGFESGDFFGHSTVLCFTWLVWLYVATFITRILYSVVIVNYYTALVPDAKTSINLDLIELMMLSMMLIVLYLLKSARLLALENKEFI